MSQDSVQLIEENIRHAKEFVELDKALQRLMENRDFRKVIQEGYLRDEAVRLVHLRGDPAFQTPERQAAVLSQIDAIGQLLGYFRTVSFNAQAALKSIEADEAMRDDLLAEGGVQ